MPKINLLDLYFGDMRAAVPDFAAIRAKGIVGIVHRASYGSDFLDPHYRAREPAARAAQLQWGASHTLDASNVNTQADTFLGLLDFQNPLCLVVDFEEAPSPPALHQLYTFCARVDANSPPGTQIAIRGGTYIRTNLHDPQGGYMHPSMVGYIQFFAAHRLWLTEPSRPGAYSDKPAYPWEILWARQFVPPIVDPAIGNIGHVCLNPASWTA